ncbi:hypothetical protein MPDQ_007448 [Monascus purpureus]|uniref:Phosphatidylserine decarboxylase n=1 Tax=Monascus purpureus TaxID=5098 RepID=A0A507QS18_MONPU|nr:hypothetical protein MPDQ_007448 [Monascus purpureus]
MFLAYYLHSLLDTVLSYYKIIETREVGWITIDRQSGQFKREQQPLWKKFKLLLLFNPLTEWIDRTHWMRLWTRDKSVAAGGRERQPRSHREIKGFIDFYQIDMSDFSPSDPEEYPTFEDFFVRKHASHARPIYQPEDRTKAIVVTDARVAVFPSVTRAKELWIKGSQFTIGKLIEDEKKADTWNDGAVASFRLSPQDYHRYHSPVAGKVKWYKRIPGSYLQVDPVALHSSVNILTENARCCVCIDSSEFGQVLFVAIGATDVGTVEFHEPMRQPGHDVEKGEEIGLFQFGGSAIVVVFENGRIGFDEDLLVPSNKEINIDVRVGQSLGKATRPRARK